MLYQEIVTICRPYLGIATEAFLNRQLSNMKLRKVSDLKENHLKILAKWCYHSAIEVMDKPDAVEMAKKILALEDKCALKSLFSPDSKSE